MDPRSRTTGFSYHWLSLFSPNCSDQRNFKLCGGFNKFCQWWALLWINFSKFNHLAYALNLRGRNFHLDNFHRYFLERKKSQIHKSRVVIRLNLHVSSTQHGSTRVQSINHPDSGSRKRKKSLALINIWTIFRANRRKLVFKSSIFQPFVFFLSEFFVRKSCCWIRALFSATKIDVWEIKGVSGVTDLNFYCRNDTFWSRREKRSIWIDGSFELLQSFEIIDLFY